jgi:hypothetical protein
MVLKDTEHVPVPPESVMVQLLSAPVIATVPDGVIPAPLTLTLTDTGLLGREGSGVSAVMVVVLAPLLTVWFSVSELVE